MEYPICDANESVLTNREKKVVKMNLPPSSPPSLNSVLPSLPPTIPTSLILPPPPVPSSHITPPPFQDTLGLLLATSSRTRFAHAPPSGVTTEAGRPRPIVPRCFRALAAPTGGRQEGGRPLPA